MLIQTNLELQLELLELVQTKQLPMWDSEAYIAEASPSKKDKGIKYRIEYQKHYRNYINLAIDLNNNRFGQWLDKVFPKEVDPLSWKSYYAEDDSEVIATTAEYFKILIGCNGLTDNILKEIIQEIKLKPDEPSK